jgi:proteasome lid subunit RPN8/RPN11
MRRTDVGFDDVIVRHRREGGAAMSVLDLHRVEAKLLLESPRPLPGAALVAVLHRYVRESAVEGLLIDVADYRHVEGGPGVIWVGHECDYRIDPEGLTYVHKGRDKGVPLRVVLRRALGACRRLECEDGLEMRFRSDEVRLTLVDRLALPGGDPTRSALIEAIERWFEDLYRPARVEVDRDERQDRDPRRLPSLRVRSAAAPGLDTLIARLAIDGPAPVPSLVLPQRMKHGLDEWAVGGYPLEVCGLLVGRSVAGRVRVERITEARNLETERSSDRFTLDPGDWLRADEAARRGGLEIVGIWHTHPDHPARPSETDLAWAWEGYSYLILSVDRSRVDAARSWRLNGGGFIEQSIEEVHS